MPEKEYVLSKAFDEFVKRMEDEDSRQNRRLELMEDHISEINKITIAIEKLAVNMEYMVKAQNDQSERIKDQSERLKAIEDRDGDKWRTVGMYIGTSIIGLIIGYLASKFGLK